MTDEELGRAWWDEQVIRAATTSECVDGPWEALAKLLRERDEWKAKAETNAVLEHDYGCGIGVFVAILSPEPGETLGDAARRIVGERDELLAVIERLEARVRVKDGLIRGDLGAIDILTERAKKAEAERDALQRENVRLASVYEHAVYVSRSLSETWREDTVVVTLPAETWKEFQRVMGGRTP